MKAVYFLVAIALVTIFFMVELFSPFLKSLIVAALLTIATSSQTFYFETKLRSRIVASTLMTIIMAGLFFLPLLYCIFSFANFFNELNQQELVKTINQIKVWTQGGIPDDFAFIKDLLQDIFERINVSQSVQNILSFGAYLGKNSLQFMIDMFFILIFFFFFTLYSKNIELFLKRILPIRREDSKVLITESSSVMTVVLYSILVTAIFEGFLFGFFLTFYHYDGLLFGVLYGFASLIPVVGGLIMWLPLVIYEGITGSITTAIIIALYSIIMISIVADTFIKPMIIKYINQHLVKTKTKVNELLIFFSIIAGLASFGFWGMIIGPAMVTFFISIMQLLKKYSDEFNED